MGKHVFVDDRKRMRDFESINKLITMGKLTYNRVGEENDMVSYSFDSKLFPPHKGLVYINNMSVQYGIEQIAITKAITEVISMKRLPILYEVMEDGDKFIVKKYDLGNNQWNNYQDENGKIIIFDEDKDCVSYIIENIL